MIGLDRLCAVRTIVCHRNNSSPCPDGVASALILRDVLPKLADVVFASHDDLDRLPVGPGMLFCDIAPTPARAGEFLLAGAIVLDHHRTARDVVRLFVEAGLGAFGDEAADPGVSGAVLAHLHVAVQFYGSGDPALDRSERFARMAGVRDTWQRSSPDWGAACAAAEALRFWPWVTWPHHPFDSDEDGHPTPDNRRFADMMAIGPVLVARNAERDRHLVDKAHWFTTTKGTRVAVLPTVETSDAADLIGDRADLVVGFGYGAAGGRPTFRLSTRSRGDYDCAALCGRWHGGGGHTRAAGASFEVYPRDPNPYAFLRAEIEAHETPVAADPVPF